MIQKMKKYTSLSFCLRVSHNACTFGTQLNGILQSSIPLQSSCKDLLDILFFDFPIIAKDVTNCKSFLKKNFLMDFSCEIIYSRRVRLRGQ